jgi:tryptophan synthase beta chain
LGGGQRKSCFFTQGGYGLHNAFAVRWLACNYRPIVILESRREHLGSAGRIPIHQDNRRQVEAGGCGQNLGQHAARFQGGRPGVLQGTYSYVLQDAAGQIANTHSVSAGLDYPSIGPEHAWLKESGRAEYVSASDAEALEASTLLARTEGIIPALESAHAVAEAMKRGPKMKKSDIVIVNISGRGDKDMGILRESLKLD